MYIVSTRAIPPDAIEQRVAATSNLTDAADWLVNLLGGQSVLSGVTVNADSAMRFSAVFTCVRILAETMSSLPMFVYRQAGEIKRRDHNSRYHALVHDQPNPEMTAYGWRGAMTTQLCLHGNAYAEIERDGGGRPVALWPLPATTVIKRRLPTTVPGVPGEIVFDVTVPGSGKKVTLPESNVLHWFGLTLDGYTGLSPIAFQRECIGLGMAMQQYGAKFYGNGGQPKGVLEHPQTLGSDAGKRLREQFDANHGSLTQAQRTLLLEEGMKYHAISIPPNDALYVEAMNFQKADIASIYRIPGHMLNIMDKATWGNIEHLGMSFVSQTLAPYLQSLEQETERKLLSSRERNRIFFEFNVEALLRGDILTRYRAYAVGRQQGFLCPNEIRARENMNPISGGDVYLVPANMLPASQLATGDGGGNPPSTNGDGSQNTATGDGGESNASTV